MTNSNSKTTHSRNRSHTRSKPALSTGTISTPPSNHQNRIACICPTILAATPKRSMGCSLKLLLWWMACILLLNPHTKHISQFPHTPHQPKKYTPHPLAHSSYHHPSIEFLELLLRKKPLPLSRPKLLPALSQLIGENLLRCLLKYTQDLLTILTSPLKPPLDYLKEMALP